MAFSHIWPAGEVTTFVPDEDEAELATEFGDSEVNRLELLLPVDVVNDVDDPGLWWCRSF